MRYYYLKNAQTKQLFILKEESRKNRLRIINYDTKEYTENFKIPKARLEEIKAEKGNVLINRSEAIKTVGNYLIELLPLEQTTMFQQQTLFNEKIQNTFEL